MISSTPRDTVSNYIHSHDRQHWQRAALAYVRAGWMQIVLGYRARSASLPVLFHLEYAISRLPHGNGSDSSGSSDSSMHATEREVMFGMEEIADYLLVSW